MEEIIPLNTLVNTIDNQIELEFSKLCFQIGDLCILKSLTGSFKPKKLCAILGPSGGGKTTLLNILSRFKTSTYVTGTITVNGQTMSDEEFRLNCSYITQEFAMLPKLTVFETLHSAADFKLNSKYTSKMKLNIVNDIIELLNLTKCTKNLIEKLSGGEQKRVLIGIELITRPPLMFFDEPTSGLDSVSAIQIITYLKQLANAGHTIICSIHQPSSKILELFDNLYVLSNGKCIYNGPLANMLQTFETAGFICPQYYNRSDFAIEIANLNECENLQKLIDYANLPELIRSYGRQLSIDKKSEENVSNNEVAAVMKTRKPVQYGYQISCLKQVYYLLKRHVISTSRDMMVGQLRIYLHIIIAIFIGCVFYDIGDNASSVITNISCLFFIILFLFFCNAMPPILTVPTETEVFMREHLNNWYSVPAYYLSKLIVDLPLQILLPLIFLKIVFYLTGQPSDAHTFLYSYFICFLVSIHAYLFGLVSGAMFNVKSSVFIIPSINIPVLIFSGFFIKYSELSTLLHPFMYLSYFRYSLMGLMIVIYDPVRPMLKCAEVYCHFKRPKSILEYIEVLDDYWFNVGGLTVSILFLLILILIVLFVRVQFRRYVAR